MGELCADGDSSQQRHVNTPGHRLGLPGTPFTKYLTTILRLSYDNAKVMIDLRRTSNLPKHLTKYAKVFFGTIHSRKREII